MVHPNKAAAIEAIQRYITVTCRLQAELGISEHCEDSCCVTYITTQYLDENGKEQTYT